MGEEAVYTKIIKQKKTVLQMTQSLFALELFQQRNQYEEKRSDGSIGVLDTKRLSRFSISVHCTLCSFFSNQDGCIYMHNIFPSTCVYIFCTMYSF